MWLISIAAGISIQGISQDSTGKSKTSTTATPQKTDWKKVNLSNRPNDHFMIQLGYDGWANKPDTIHTTGFSRSFNFYLMYDIPFKTAPRLSVAPGLGVGSSSMFFSKTDIDIVGKVNPVSASFMDVSGSNHFKKYKLNNTWVEVPVELRFVADPLHSGKSWKVAMGVKIGTMVDAHTKGKDLQTSTGTSLYGSKYIEKEKSRRFFNSTKFAVTLRAGWGPVTAFGSYTISKIFKQNSGPDVYPYSFGLCLSGL